eukprot:scaffold7465_cov239-Pinguiococcus_pyrenoidosus.AAC.1
MARHPKALPHATTISQGVAGAVHCLRERCGHPQRCRRSSGPFYLHREARAGGNPRVGQKHAVRRHKRRRGSREGTERKELEHLGGERRSRAETLVRGVFPSAQVSTTGG